MLGYGEPLFARMAVMVLFETPGIDFKFLIEVSNSLEIPDLIKASIWVLISCFSFNKSF